MALAIHPGDDLGLMAGHLATALAADPPDPCGRELIVVSDPGLRAWLQLQLAEAWGIAASLVMPTPAAFCRQFARWWGDGDGMPFPLVAVDESVDDPWSPERLRWTLEALLRTPPDDASLRTHLSAGHADPELRRWRLADRLAVRFADYQLHRPGLVLGWERGVVGDHPHEGWQAALWRALVERLGPDHTAHRLDAALQHLSAGKPRPGLPARLTIFGCTSLPAVVADLVRALASVMPVRIYPWAPSPVWWEDLAHPRSLVRARAAGRDPESEHREAGHRLLVGWGRPAQEGLRQWAELDRDGQAWEPVGFRERPDTLLGGLQQAIAAAVPPPHSSIPAFRHSGISLLICHEPRREVEALRERLLALFAADPTLHPADVLVLVPDVAVYAPWIQAVLAGMHPRLPCTVSDQEGVTDPLATALLGLLDLRARRCSAPALLEFLALEPVARRFELDEADLVRLRAWVVELGTSWGLDAADRSTQVAGMPELSAGTWRDLADRAVLGACIDGDAPLWNLAPLSGATRLGATLAGRLAQALDTVARHLPLLDQAQTLAVWAERLRSAVADCCDPGDAEPEGAQHLGRVLDALAGQDHAGLVAAPVVRAHLEQALAGEPPGQRVRGDLLVAKLRPRRIPPRRVVAVLGLEAGTLPRSITPQPWDLLAHDRRPGDPDPRRDDRLLFLELLLAAEHLVLAWPGRSPRDDSPREPSPLVAELIDHLQRERGLPPACFLFPQPLAPPREPSAEPVFAVPVAAEVPDIDGDLLAAWWTNPAQVFCRRVLRLRLADELDAPAADEAFTLEPLAASRPRAALAAGADPDTVALRSALPLGPFARTDLDGIVTEVDTLRAEMPGDAPEPERTVQVDGVAVRLNGLRPSGIAVLHASRPKASQRIAAWIRHLAANVVIGPTPSLLVTRAESGAKALCWRLRPIDAALARRHLADLVAGLREGWSMPPPLLPEASFTWASTGDLDKTRTDWEGSDFAGGGDRRDPALALVWRARDPLADEAFESWSQRLWLPILDAVEKPVKAKGRKKS